MGKFKKTPDPYINVTSAYEQNVHVNTRYFTIGVHAVFDRVNQDEKECLQNSDPFRASTLQN